jgi:predicted metal-dependent hydrolase
MPKRGILTFNYALVHAPVECIEYVVFHEFTHFAHPDHSKNFYARLSIHIPDYRERKKRLEKTAIL